MCWLNYENFVLIIVGYAIGRQSVASIFIYVVLLFFSGLFDLNKYFPAIEDSYAN